MYGNLYRRCVFLQELDASKGMRCEENACDTKTGHFTKTGSGRTYLDRKR
jgi:hypothetical protein